MHKFIYENEYTEQEPRKITIEVGMDADLTEMLESFESYLRAVGYNFDGVLDIHPEDSFDEAMREFVEDLDPDPDNRPWTYDCSGNKVAKDENGEPMYQQLWTQDMSGTGQYVFGKNYDYHDHGDLVHDSYYPNDYDVKVTYGKSE